MARKESLANNHFPIVSDEYIRGVFMQAPAAIVVYKGSAFIIDLINEKALKVWGLDYEKAINQPLFKIMPQLYASLDPLFTKVYLSGEPYNASEFPMHFTRNGIMHEGIFNFVLNPVYDTNGTIIGITSISTDVTFEVTARKRIEESEKLFRFIADAMPQKVWTADADGNRNYFNKQWLDYTGLNLEALQNEGWKKIVHPDDLTNTESRWQHALETGKDFEAEDRKRDKEGNYKWHLSRASPFRDETGEIKMWIGTNTEVEKQKMQALEFENAVEERTKELKEKNQTLAESEKRIQTMFEAAPDAVIIIDQQGIISNWNHEAENIFGWEKGEVIGKPLAEIIIPQRYRERHKEGLNNFMRTGKGRVLNKPIEIEALRRDNTEIPVELKISAYVFNNNPPVFIGFIRDISKRRQSENALTKKTSELIEANANLEKVNKELESFTYISSHDLQEPLRKIQTFAARILEKENQHLSDNAKDYFHRIQQAAGRMQALILDLLSFSRVNYAERKFELTDLNKIVEEVKTDLNEAIEEKGATIETKELCHQALVIRFQFRQLLYNLISNSIKFSKPGVPPLIIIQSELLASYPLFGKQVETCHITISDNGIGFGQDFSEKIFQLFQKLHGKYEYPGTGIGLAIVNKIVENHNGIINATSELGKGARFDIYIPV